jgi:predicted nucleic acid-binding protein
MFHKLVDTNILYDALADNTQSQKAQKVISEPICIFEGVLYELANLLKNTKGTDYACECLDEILSSPQIFKILKASHIEKQEALKIMKKYQVNEPKKDYSLVDALQFVISQREHLELYTLDERMGFYDQGKVRVVVPY